MGDVTIFISGQRPLKSISIVLLSVSAFDPDFMRLLLVTREDISDRMYGLGRSLTPLADALTMRGHHVRYLCRADRSSRAEGRVRTIHRRLAAAMRPIWAEADDFLAAFLERVDMGRLAAQLAARDRYTHVHLHDPWLAWGYRMFAHAYRNGNVRWGITEHGFGSYSQATLDDGLRQGPRLRRWLRRMEDSTLAAADWVITPTRAALEQLAFELGLPRPAMHWHAIPHARPALALSDRDSARTQLGWSPNALYVLGIGRLVPLKRFPWLIDACAALAGDVRLVLLGNGDREFLRHYGARAGLRNPIEFAVTGNVGCYLSAADIYVSSSSTESFGMANLEALTAGTAALCTRVGGVQEVMGDAAYLVPGEPGALREALATLVTNPGLRAEYAARGRARASAWPDIDAIAGRYESVYERIDRV